MKNFFLSVFLLLTLSVQAQKITFDYYDYTVSGTENWTAANNPITRVNGGVEGVIRIAHSLTIPAGAQLTINNMRIEMGPNAAITIKAATNAFATGGSLEVNSSTLTAYRNCDDANSADNAWAGIIVENATTGSGALIMNGSTISDAGIGIQYAAAQPETASDAPNNNKQALQVWPSPNDGAFNIYMTSAANENVHITIANMAGQIIKEAVAVTNKNTTIQIDAQPGMYVITAVTTYGKQCAKVIVR